MHFVERQSRGYSRATIARWSPVAGGIRIWNTIFRDLTSHTALEMRMQSRRRLVAACRSTLLRACDRVASCEGGQRDQAVAIGSSRELPAATALSLSRSCQGLHLNQCSAIGRATQSRDTVASCEGALWAPSHLAYLTRVRNAAHKRTGSGTLN